MTKLDAVNEMLAWVGQPAATALDTNGTSDEGEAEAFLDRINAEVQEERQWQTCIIDNLELVLPTVKIGVSGGSGTFQWHEVVTETTSGATGLFAYIESNAMYLIPVSGTFTGGKTLTGGTSAATKTGGTYAAVTSAKHSLSTAFDNVQASESYRESARVVVRDNFLFDVDTNSATFTRNVHIDATQTLAFDALPDKLARYVSKFAAYQFYLYKLREEPTPSRVAEVTRARVRAIQYDTDLKDIDLTQTRDTREVKGYRPPIDIRTS